MANAARQSTVDTTTMEGLDELLESQNDVQGRVDSEDWTVEEAADYLGLSVKTIRRRLKERKLDGYKIDGLNGPEWRIKLHTLVNDHGRDTLAKPTATTVQGADLMTGNSTLVKELIEKLEVLTYRNGYLEAQLLEREDQLKLISDASKKSGWTRFWRWLTR